VDGVHQQATCSGRQALLRHGQLLVRLGAADQLLAMSQSTGDPSA
jgi:hypothetical protein